MHRVNKRTRNTTASVALLALFSGLNSAALRAETHVVEMKDYKFIPEEITIKVGDTVRWVNTERRQYHTIWFKELGEKESVEYFPEERHEKTFDKAGTYPYLSGPHWEERDMKGIVHVVE